MSTAPKRKVIKEYSKLDSDFLKKLKEKYPDGYGDDLVSFYGADGLKIRAIPYETEETYYLIKVPIATVKELDGDDDDSNDSDDDSFDSYDSGSSDGDDADDDE